MVITRCHMGMGFLQSVLTPVPMHIEIGNHAQTNELVANEVPR